MRWMKLEPIIQSEVSQKEKHQYSILTHIYGTLKDGNNTIAFADILSTVGKYFNVGVSEDECKKLPSPLRESEK